MGKMRKVLNGNNIFVGCVCSFLPIHSIKRKFIEREEKIKQQEEFAKI